MRNPCLALVLVAACSASTSNPGAGSDSPDAAVVTSDPDAPPPSEARPNVPMPTGTCPAITKGDVTFAPAGIPPRKVKLELDPNATATGPLVLYWHATGSSPQEAAYALGATQAKITAKGGVIASPYSDPAAGQFEWYLVNGSPKQDDFILADEIVACLAAAHRIDTTHVHSMGMSAGALQTSALSLLRASYIASVATYSGGLTATIANQDPTNKFAALIFDGGAADNVFGVDFVEASKRYQQLLQAAGHFTVLCDHGKGHSIPLDAAPGVASFFETFGFGDTGTTLPPGLPSYCSL